MSERADVSRLIGDNVRGLRHARGLRQEELVDRLRDAGLPQMTRSILSATERHDRRVTVDELAPLCLALDCSLAELLGGRAGAAAREALGL